MPVVPENRDDEQMAVRHADASGVTSHQHEENRMRDIHVGKKGSEAASEEQPDSAGTTHVSLEYLCPTKNCQQSGNGDGRAVRS